MDSALSPAIKRTLDDKIAALCERPHLRSDYLPRFVLIMLEHALHSLMCSFAACFKLLIERYRAGTLEPWPDEDAEAPRCSRYKMKFPPAAPKCRTGAKHVQSLAADMPAVVPECGLDQGPAQSFAQDGRLAIRPALPCKGDIQALFAGPRLRSCPQPWASFRLSDRCRSALLCSAAEMRRDNCVRIVSIIQL